MSERIRTSDTGGFTLLEVLVAMVIVGLGVATVLQVASQNLRLLKLSGEHQEAVALADQLVRLSEPDQESLDGGQEGAFSWERRVVRVPVPDELSAPGQPRAELWSVAVAVRWGENRAVQISTLRASVGDPLDSVNPLGEPAAPTDSPGRSGEGDIEPTQPGSRSGGRTTPGSRSGAQMGTRR
ncbi:MAG: prepilin-type N-terminal cleavage/methylation domain-containing protein [Candidatus Rokubacteria bacterium]|nr:prepilin-type N-terminal cleavage/methylation domain-containing protein [Candidatus Rokubacteria bacterium]